MDKSLKRGPIDQFLKQAPAGPVQDAPQPPLPEQQPPPPQNAQTAQQQDPAAAVANDIGRRYGSGTTTMFQNKSGCKNSCQLP